MGENKIIIGGYRHLYRDRWLRLDPELLEIVNPEDKREEYEDCYDILFRNGKKTILPFHAIVFGRDLPETIRLAIRGGGV